MAEQQSLNAILLQIAKHEQFTSPKFAIDDAPTHGYLAEVNTITLKDAQTGKTLHLFAKNTPSDAASDLKFLYTNESVFYNKVIPQFRELLSSLNPETSLTLPRVPRIYYASEEIIIMENLMETGFKVWNPLSKQLDANHVEAVLAAYGKFHAFSFALKHKSPEKFKSTGLKFEWFITHHEKFMNNGYYKNLAEKLADAFDEDTEFEYIEAIAKFLSDDLKENLIALDESDDNDVFIHGDSWTHNFMFRYDSLNYCPKEVCLLDFQIFRKTSPAVDLSYFLGICAGNTETFEHVWEYLKVYHNSLQNTLIQLKCPTDLYPWETLKDDWRKFALKGLLMTAIVLKMMIADKDELEARKEIALPMQFDFISRNEELYRKQMRTVIKYFYDEKILKP